jgi:8-oxo-dGTP pyrophosphatase MutT (NUDIX family)
VVRDDDTDTSLIAAALREAQEEVAIPPDSVEVIGVLPPVDSVTGFRVLRRRRSVGDSDLDKQ